VQPVDGLDRLPTVGGLADHLDVGLGEEKHAQALAGRGIVVDEDDAQAAPGLVGGAGSSGVIGP
jgi:hypothetical protein